MEYPREGASKAKVFDGIETEVEVERKKSSPFFKINFVLLNA
jgi:hypothetical protein